MKATFKHSKGIRYETVYFLSRRLLHCTRTARWLFFTMTRLILALYNVMLGAKMKATVTGILKNVGRKMI